MSRAPRPGAAFLVVLPCLVWAACGPDGGPEGPDRGTGEAQTSGARAVREYRLRGVVEAPPAGPGGSLRIRHEPLPGLVGPSGEIEGMTAMTMPFPLAEGLDTAALAAGDAIAFTLEVDWDAPRPIVITAIEPLRPGTELDLD